MSGGGSTTSDPRETQRRLESEVAAVTTAIKLVASGAASRVTLTGLSFGEQVAAKLGPEAAAEGIRIEPLYWAEDAGCDLLVRSGDDA